jgi:hypothetical protein
MTVISWVILSLVMIPILLVFLLVRVSTLGRDNRRMSNSLEALTSEIEALKTRLDRAEDGWNDEPRPARATAQAARGFDIDAIHAPVPPPAEAPYPEDGLSPEDEEALDCLPCRPSTDPGQADWPAASVEIQPATIPAQTPEPVPASSAAESASELPAAVPAHTPPPGPRAGPSFIERAVAAAKDWLLGGNTVLRAGVLLLFIGLAFLLRYTAERVTVEFHYIAVAGAALALLALGWRLRLKSAAYGLTLQGAGIAVLYLTSFSAMRLHDLLPPVALFALLVLFTAAAAALAVLQDAVILASAAALGGFATPILVSTGGGNHVALFAYFALLNAGILLVAWFKAWRILNLIGFFGTFGIGFAWGIQHYEPEKFVSTEPFLALFFLMYVCIGLLFARRRLLEADQAPEDAGRHAMLRWSVGRTDYVDGTLVFGPPLIGFGLQYVIVDPFYLGTAFSALALGLFYLVLAYGLRGRKRVGLLMEICLALGVIFVTLTVPFAFDSRGVISATWAVEGAGIYWLGLVQGRRLPRAFSVALIAVSALAYLQDTGIGDATLLANSPLGAALLGAALLFCHRALRRTPAERVTRADRPCLPAFAGAGLAFLYLIAPLCLGREGTAIAWALAGVATMFAGTRLRSRAFVVCALGIQTLGGLLFPRRPAPRRRYAAAGLAAGRGGARRRLPGEPSRAAARSRRRPRRGAEQAAGLRRRRPGLPVSDRAAVLRLRKHGHRLGAGRTGDDFRQPSPEFARLPGLRVRHPGAGRPAVSVQRGNGKREHPRFRLDGAGLRGAHRPGADRQRDRRPDERHGAPRRGPGAAAGPGPAGRSDLRQPGAGLRARLERHRHRLGGERPVAAVAGAMAAAAGHAVFRRRAGSGRRRFLPLRPVDPAGAVRRLGARRAGARGGGRRLAHASCGDAAGERSRGKRRPCLDRAPGPAFQPAAVLGHGLVGVGRRRPDLRVHRRTG